MSVRSILRDLSRRLGPPGNRGSLDTEYRQPNGGPGGQGTPNNAPVDLPRR